MEATFHFGGDLIDPSDAVHMADPMISGGFLGRWTCAHIPDLVTPYISAVVGAQSEPSVGPISQV